MAKIVTLGEIMLRLSPPGYQRFIQATSFDATYGGSEANVAVCLANFGHDVSYITKLPANALGESVLGTLRKSNVDCSHIIFGGARLGTYYLENGVSVRPASVVYDREGSSMATAKAEEFDWDAILEGADLLHTSGITPVLSEDAKEIVLQALKAAKAKRITTSFDLNYRGKLWTTGVKEKQEMMAGLMPYVDICFGNARDAAMVLGYRDKNTDFINGDYDICINTENMQKVLNYFGFTYLVSSLRNSLSASYNGYSGEVVTAQKWHIGKKFMVNIVDRVGSGDAFASGFLDGFLLGKTEEACIDFAIASAAIKHTIPGDINYISRNEVENLAGSDGEGRVVR